VKIFVAKLNKEPYHSLTTKDIKLIFKLVPENWKSLVTQVVLGAEMFSNSRFDRPVIHSAVSSRLNVLSRGLSKERIVKEVFRELALNGGEAQSGFANHVSKPELVKLDRVVEPYINRFFENEI
jgi:hypothetical protein